MSHCVVNLHTPCDADATQLHATKYVMLTSLETRDTDSLPDYNVDLKFVRRPQRRPNINSTMGKHVEFSRLSSGDAFQGVCRA